MPSTSEDTAGFALVSEDAALVARMICPTRARLLPLEKICLANLGMVSVLLGH